MKHRHRVILAGCGAVLVAGLLAGCDSASQPGGDPTDAPTGSPPAATSTSEASTSPEGTASATAATPSGTPSPSTTPAVSPSAIAAATGGPGTYPNGEADLELSQTSDSGVTVDLTRIAVEGNTLSLDVTGLNGTPNEIYLANGGPNRPDAVSVTIGDGAPLLFQPPPDNEELTVPSGGELTGTLSFVGRIPEDARAVTVVFNAVFSNQVNVPEITFDEVPLP